MSLKLVNVTKSTPFKMQSGMSYRIEFPQGLAEKQNKEWLESFVENVFVKEGFVLDYKFEINQGDSKNYLHITVRGLENERSFRVENSPAPLVNSSQVDQKISQKSVKRRSFLRLLRRGSVTLFIGLPLFIFSRTIRLMGIINQTKLGSFLLFLMICTIIRKIFWNFGYKMPSWLEFFIW